MLTIISIDVGMAISLSLLRNSQLAEILVIITEG